jgi:hypothetical protein
MAENPPPEVYIWSLYCSNTATSGSNTVRPLSTIVAPTAVIYGQLRARIRPYEVKMDWI